MDANEILYERNKCLDRKRISWGMKSGNSAIQHQNRVTGLPRLGGPVRMLATVCSAGSRPVPSCEVRKLLMAAHFCLNFFTICSNHSVLSALHWLVLIDCNSNTKPALHKTKNLGSFQNSTFCNSIEKSALFSVNS